MKILCTICFKKKSYGLKGKNFLQLMNKPLYVHTYNTAKKIKDFKNIVLLSDGNIKKNDISKNTIIAERPKIISQKYTPKMDVILYALEQAEKNTNIQYDIIVDLDVTAPLRNVNDIKNCIKIFKMKKPLNLFSVNISKKNPYFNMVEKKNQTYKLIKYRKNYSARQKTPKVYDMNASIYIWSRKSLLRKEIFTKKTEIYEMPFERSIDIDSQNDLDLIKYIMKKKNS
jgi:CMP-N,N'-diacetyllegionaminic acid synthase